MPLGALPAKQAVAASARSQHMVAVIRAGRGQMCNIGTVTFQCIEDAHCS